MSLNKFYMLHISSPFCAFLKFKFVIKKLFHFVIFTKKKTNRQKLYYLSCLSDSPNRHCNFFELMQVWHNTPVFLDHSVSFIMFCKTERVSFTETAHIFMALFDYRHRCLSWKTERHPQDFIFFFSFMSCRERALNFFVFAWQKVHWADYPIDYVVRHALSCP